MKRSRISRRKSKRMFRKVANKVKSINISPKVSRGGIRL